MAPLLRLAWGRPGGETRRRTAGRHAGRFFSCRWRFRAAAYALAYGQRALSTPARQLRRKTRSVSGTLILNDGSEQHLDEPALLRPLELALRAFSWGVVLLGLGLIASKVL